jgi:hypothetical protein
MKRAGLIAISVLAMTVFGTAAQAMSTEPLPGSLSGSPFVNAPSNSFNPNGGPGAPSAVTNSYGRYDSPYDPNAAANAAAAREQTRRERQRERLNVNPYDPNSMANPYGGGFRSPYGYGPYGNLYGVPYSRGGMSTPNGQFSDPYSPLPYNQGYPPYGR